MRKNPLVVGVAVVIGLLVLAFGLVFPRGREATRVQGEIAQAREQVASLNAQLAAVQGINAAALAAEIAAIRSEVPATPALPDLLRSLTGAAATAGVELGAISLGSPTASNTGAVSVIGLSIAVSGTYFQIARFLFELETLDRLSRVNSVSLSPGATKALSASISAEVYTTDTNAGPGSDPAPGPEVGA